MTEDRYIIVANGLELSIKDCIENKYPFSMVCEDIDSFETLLNECINVKTLLNEKESEINRYLYILKLRDDGETLYIPDRDCRILTHMILKYLREFDNIGFNYNKYLDNMQLQSFLGQCVCWSEHISKKEGDVKE